MTRQGYTHTQANTQLRLRVSLTKAQICGHGQSAGGFGGSRTIPVVSLSAIVGGLVGWYPGGCREEILLFQQQTVIRVLLRLVEVVGILVAESVTR